MARRQNTKIQARLPYKLYYFVCEDEKSMPYYLKGLKQKYDWKKRQIKTDTAIFCVGNRQFLSGSLFETGNISFIHIQT